MAILRLGVREASIPEVIVYPEVQSGLLEIEVDYGMWIRRWQASTKEPGVLYHLIDSVVPTRHKRFEKLTQGGWNTWCKIITGELVKTPATRKESRLCNRILASVAKYRLETLDNSK